MQKKQIPAKNYYILGSIIIITIALAFYLTMWYNTAKEYRMNNSIITTVLGELTMEELDNYLLENPEVIIYMASSKDQTIKDFEDEFKTFLIKNDLKNNFIYVDVSKINTPEFYQSFANKYYTEELKNKQKNLDIIPNALMLENGKVIDLMYRRPIKIKKEDIKVFLKKHGVINYD